MSDLDRSRETRVEEFMHATCCSGWEMVLDGGGNDKGFDPRNAELGLYAVFNEN